MSYNLNYIVIFLVIFLVLRLGSYFTQAGMGWYAALQLPIITPPSWVFIVVWNVIFVMVAISTIIIYNRLKHTNLFRQAVILLSVNGIINVLWTYVFFVRHAMVLALIVALVLAAITWWLITLLWRPLRSAALLLLPYGMWLVFACLLNYWFILLN